MCRINKSDSLKRFYDPAGKRGSAVLLLGWEENAGCGVREHVWAHLESLVLHQITWCICWGIFVNYKELEKIIALFIDYAFYCG